MKAAYAAPIIMMAKNIQSQRDRLRADSDNYTNVEAKKEIEPLQIQLSKIVTEKLDIIIKMLKKIKSK